MTSGWIPTPASGSPDGPNRCNGCVLRTRLPPAGEARAARREGAPQRERDPGRHDRCQRRQPAWSRLRRGIICGEAPPSASQRQPSGPGPDSFGLVMPDLGPGVIGDPYTGVGAPLPRAGHDLAAHLPAHGQPDTGRRSQPTIPQVATDAHDPTDNPQGRRYPTAAPTAHQQCSPAGAVAGRRRSPAPTDPTTRTSARAAVLPTSNGGRLTSGAGSCHAHAGGAYQALRTSTTGRSIAPESRTRRFGAQRCCDSSRPRLNNTLPVR